MPSSKPLVIKNRRYGIGWELHCSQCGQVDFTPFNHPYGKRDIWDHRRHVHPTPEEAEMDSLRRAENELDTCERCGLAGHDGPSCPSAQPWMLKNRDQ